MNIPTHRVRLAVVVKDREKFAAYAQFRRSSPDQPLSDLVLGACVYGGQSEKECGYSIVFASVANDVKSDLCEVDLHLRLSRPEVLNEAALVAMTRLGIEPDTDTFPSTARQVAMEILARARRDGFDPGFEVTSDPSEEQDGVRFSWVYPDEDGDGVPAYVDVITGYVSHGGVLPPHIHDISVRKRVETDAEIYDVVNVRTAGERSSWILRPSALHEFQRSMAQKEVVREATYSPGHRG